MKVAIILNQTKSNYVKSSHKNCINKQSCWCVDEVVVAFVCFTVAKSGSLTSRYGGITAFCIKSLFNSYSKS